MHILKFNDIKEALSGVKHCTGVQVKHFLNEYIEKKYSVSNVISLTTMDLLILKKVIIYNALINKLKKNGITD